MSEGSCNSHRHFKSSVGETEFQTPVPVMAAISFSVESAVRGYHVYQATWSAVIGEELNCHREEGNVSDPFAVAVVRAGVMVGHVPRKISTVCSVFLRRSGSELKAVVTGPRRYSTDLPQGGLEVPCTYILTGQVKFVNKAKIHLQAALGSKDPSSKESAKENLSDGRPPEKKPRIVIDDDEEGEDEDVWVENFGITLKKADKESILKGDKLNDLVVDFAQFLVKRQFGVCGLRSTLLQSKEQNVQPRQLQVLHVRQDHWIVASSLSGGSAVQVYDTVYGDIDETTKACLLQIFGSSKYTMVSIPRQVGGRDCGVYAIAIITALAYGKDPSTISFKQSTMRSHLVSCLDNQYLTLFHQ